MTQLSEITAVMSRLGVRDPKNPSAKDIKVVLDAYLKDKSLDTEVFSTYVKSMSVPLKAMFEGFAQFSADSKEVAKSTIDVIKQAMDILGQELKRENLSDEDRREIRDHVLRLVAEARDESDKERTFRTVLTYAGSGVAGIASGLVVFALTRGKNTEVLTRGVELISKVAAKAG